MEVSGHLSGGTAMLKKYQVGETFANAGVIATIDVSAEAGINLATTSNAIDMVGVTLDTATLSSTQGTGASSAEELVTISCRPDAIVRSRMSGGATSGTSLASVSVTVADSGGTTVETGATWSNPTFLNGTVWGLAGSNVGQSRKLTTVSSTVGTMLVPLDYGTVVNDTFLRVVIHPHASVLVQLTSDFTEVDAEAALASDAELACIDLELNGVGDSYAKFISKDHLYGAST